MDVDCRGGELCLMGSCSPLAGSGQNTAGSSGNPSDPLVKGGSSGNPSNQCDPSQASSACGQCGASKCCDQLSACESNQQCVDLIDCMSGCSTDSCYNGCGSKFPGGIDDVNALGECLSTSCESACSDGGGGSPGGTNCSDIYKPSTCSDCIEQSCCDALASCVDDANCLACLQGDDGKCQGTRFTNLNSCVNKSCQSECSDGGGSAGSGGSSGGGPDQSEFQDKCSKGAAVLCFCIDDPTDSCMNAAYSACMSGDDELGFATFCGYTFYGENAPDCSSYLNTCN
jgi:hypothetical protein